MQKTRLRLMLEYPFFGSLALTLEHKENPAVRTCCTDGKSLTYNPQFIDSLTPNEKLFLYLHEICHIILGHSVRRNQRDPKLWNIAGDHAVNLLLRESVDLPRPDGGLCNQEYSGMAAEQIYDKLDQEFPEDIRNPQPPPEPEPDPDAEPEEQVTNPDGEADDEPGNTPTEAEFPEDQPPLPLDNQNADAPEQEGSDTEAPEQDRIERYRDMVDRMERFGAVEDPEEDTGLTEAEINSTTSLIDRMLNNANTPAPEPIRRLVRQFVSARVPWQDLLAQFIHLSCEQQYNWMRPNRRFSSSPFILPSIERTPELSIAVVIDTSGSIDDNLLNLFMSELTSLMASVEYSKIHMISCSHRIFAPQSFDKGQVIDYQPTGEGETKFAPAFEHVQSIDPPPACVIYFTDLFSDDFGQEPSMPVLWIGNYNNEWLSSHQVRVPFGEIITMYEGE